MPSSLSEKVPIKGENFNTDWPELACKLLLSTESGHDNKSMGFQCVDGRACCWPLSNAKCVSSMVILYALPPDLKAICRRPFRKCNRIGLVKSAGKRMWHNLFTWYSGIPRCSIVSNTWVSFFFFKINTSFRGLAPSCHTHLKILYTLT